MIKWLNEITVTTEESDNFFHFNDNRVLPEHVTAEIANAEGWWYKVIDLAKKKPGSPLYARCVPGGCVTFH